MAKWRHRECNCGKVDFTASKSDACFECYWAERSSVKIAEEKEKVFSIYGNIDGPTYDNFNKRCYTFVHSCGTKQTWRFDNLLKQLKTQSEPCQSCGGKERVKKALDAYVKIYGRDYANIDYEDWEAYRLSVRRLTEITWRDNQLILNRDGIERSMTGHHLDHKVPIIICFRESISVERAAAVDNLRLISASDNLARSWYDYDLKLLEALR